MNITIIYKDEILDPVGTKNVVLEDKIIDEIFENANIPATIIFDSEFKYNNELNINLFDINHIYFEFNIREFNYENNLFRRTLINELLQNKKEDIENLVGVNLERQNEGLNESTKWIFYRIDINFPSFCLHIPIDKDYTFLQLYELIIDIEKFISNIIEQTAYLSQNITSIQRPN